MSMEHNKAIVVRFYEEAVNAKNMDAVDELVQPDVPALKEWHLENTVKQQLRMFHGAFPDAHVTIEELIAEGDKVVARFTMQGTHQGDWFGIPPTGRAVKIRGIEIFCIANGKITEHWDVVDSLGLAQQLGIVRVPSGAVGNDPH
jgi:steroid delta-isomerase-like uncharacterized protein